MFHNFNAYVDHTIQLKMTELDLEFKFKILGSFHTERFDSHSERLQSHSERFVSKLYGS